MYVNICQICLRTDKKLNVVDSRLSEFHDELCEYALAFTPDPQYCLECEYMLRKVYNFRARCLMANKLLQNCRKSKTPKDRLYTLLPPTTLGTWQESKARIYQYNYDDQSLPMLSINGGQIQPKGTIKLEPEVTSPEHVSVPAVFPKGETEISIQNVANHNNLTESSDPLMNTVEIKTENLDDFGDLKSQNDLNSSQICIETRNIFDSVDVKTVPVVEEQITTNDLLCGLENVKTDSVLNDLDELMKNVDVPDDSSLNSADDCDSDDFILNDLVYNRRKRMKEKKLVTKKKTQNKSNNSKKRRSNLENPNLPKKKSLLELTNTSISDVELPSDDDEQIEEKNEVPKKKVIKKVRQGKVTKKMLDSSIVLNPEELNDYAAEAVKKFCENIPKRTRKLYNRDRLISNLTNKFDSCGELKTEDGTVIDKECILHIIGEEEPSKVFRELWDEVRVNTTLTAKAVSLLDLIQNKDNEYKTVFQIQYLNTKEKMLEEFEKRRSYESFVEAEFKCEFCLQWFKFEKLLDYHMKWHDPKAGEFVCSICKTRKRTRTRLVQHMNTHKTVYKCKLCPLVTNYRGSMLNHFRQHQGVEYRCEHCNLTYKSRSAYNSHRTNMCKQEQRKLVCTRCARTFMHEHGLRLHLQLKHRDEPPIDEAISGTCSQCSLTFASQEVFERHLRVSHEQDVTGRPLRAAYKERARRPGVIRKPSVFTCRVCNAKGKSHGWLTLHFELEHPTVDMTPLYSDKAKVLCDVCGKGYSSVYALRDHMHIHTNERPFACDQCPARFRTRIYLSSHKQQHAPPKWPCVRCGKKFRSKGNLYCHMRSHIGDRRFKCSICGKGFLHRGALKEHVRGVHDNVRRVKKPGVSRGSRGTEGSKEQRSDSE